MNKATHKKRYNRKKQVERDRKFGNRKNGIKERLKAVWNQDVVNRHINNDHMS